MSELLRGKALHWTCWDDRHLLTAQLQTLLSDWGKIQSIKSHFTSVDNLAHYESLLGKQHFGLSAWAVRDESPLEQLCLILSAARAHPQSPLQICYLAPELAEHIPLLAEAGAQIVLSQLTSLESTLSRLLPRVALSTMGFHPLTGGLIERLPGTEAEETGDIL